jgi:hypothetical protein
VLEVHNALPYADLNHLDAQSLERCEAEVQPREFSHTLESQIGGQLAAGSLISILYEDRSDDPERDVLSRYLDLYIATRAVKAFASLV